MLHRQDKLIIPVLRRLVTMLRKLSAILLTMMVLVCAIPLAAVAEIAPPATLGAPEHFGVTPYYGSAVNFNLSAPDDLRAYIEKRAADDPENKQTFSVYFQVDYKIDNGSWHHTAEWDSPKTVPDAIDSLYFTFVNEKDYNGNGSWPMTTLFPEDEALKAFHESGYEYLKSHSITFRARFTQSFDYGETFVLSPWSKEFILSSNTKADYNRMINHAPQLVSAELGATPSGEPYFNIRLAPPPGDILDLHSISSGSMRTEVWMRRAGDKDFKCIDYEWAGYELLYIEASDYFSVDGTEQSYDAEGYEIKVRYALDLRQYKQSGYADNSSNVDIYSPFSNVISRNMPAWSNTSQWAEGEVQKAVNNGLYPDKLQGADLTRPITRAEFAAVALKLYEAISGKTADPAPSNTFTDTQDSDVLKAFALDIVAGVGNKKFAPDDYVNREQAATMLTRVYKKLNWEGWTLDGDGAYTKHSLDNEGMSPFTDDAKISDWAKPSVYFMAKYEIIKGVAGNNFAPKNTTTEEEAAGYANATREQALVISNRTYEKVDKIQDGGPVTTTQTQPAQPPQANNGSVTGTWVLGTLSGGTFNAATGKYEGGASGLGQYYTFKPDGSYTALVKWSNTMFFSGKYSVNNGKLTLTDRVCEESNDDGATWSAKETLPDTSAYFTAGADDSGKYLLIGEEGAAPPLEDKKNAMKYKLTAGDAGNASNVGGNGKKN